MNLRLKMAAAFLAMSTALLLLSGISVLSQRHLVSALRANVQASDEMRLAVSLEAECERMRSAAQASQVGVVIALLERGAKQEGRCGGCHDAAMGAKHHAAFEEGGRAVLRHLNDLEAADAGGNRRDQLELIRRNVVEWQDAARAYKAAADGGGFDSAHELLVRKVFPLMEEAGKAAAEAGTAAHREREAAAGVEIRRAAAVTLATLAVVVFSLGVGGVALFTMRRACRVLRHVAGDLKTSAAEVQTSGENIGRSSRELADSTAKQLQALDQTVAEGRQVSQAAQANSRSAAEADEVVAHVAERTVEARRSLEGMLEATSSVHTAGEQIARIVRIIDGIAFQTNILALNAAVEAARAGGSGQGFAVVADEVRSLAQKCAEAARETSALVEELRRRASESCERVESVDAAVKAIAGDTEQVRTLVARVHQASASQAEGIERLEQALTRIEASTGPTQNSAQQGASEADALYQTASRLSLEVGELNDLVGASRMGCAGAA